MLRRIQNTALCVPIALFGAAANAEDAGWFSNQTWTATIRAGYVTNISSDGEFIGPTESVYGGSPPVMMDDGYQYTFAVGRELLDSLRLEFEIGSIATQSSTATVLGQESRADDAFSFDANADSTLYMVNLSFDFDWLGWWATPYLRGGLGVAENSVDASYSVDFDSPIWQGTPFEGSSLADQPFAEGNTTEFAWSIAAGFKKQLAERWALRVDYSVLDRGEAWTEPDSNGDSVFFSELRSQQLNLGIDWRFR